MSERDVFIKCIPMIAEIVVECSKMNEQEYEDWKRETMEAVDDRAKEFIKKVLNCIDAVMEKEKSGAA